MFLKKTKSKGKIYLQVVHSFKDDNNITRHKVLVNLGRLDKLREDESILRILRELDKLLDDSLDFSNGEVEGQQVLNWGYCVYKRQWEKYGLPSILNEIASLMGLKYSLNDVVFYEVLNHLLNPASKLTGFKKREKVYANLKTHDDMNVFYRCLDVLADHKDEIEQAVFEKNRSLFNMSGCCLL